MVLFTSGTTSAPKAALLRHRHLMAYLLGTVEFASAGEDEAVLVAVPPYHVAGVANELSNLFAGRRLVFLRSFDPEVWLETVRSEGITNAMVVPTMLARIVAALGGEPADVPTLRTLSYGGAKVSERVLLSALEAFPDTGFVNAYGLTETASTIAVLGPDDHRAAISSDDPTVRSRLTSAGRVLPIVEIEIRDEFDQPLPVGNAGMVYLRGDQISGEYAGGSLLDADGWFWTRDRGWVDADGFLFIEGRADDTIIRGGENIAPAEIEEVLLRQPAVAEACVVGIPDDEWGQRIEAAVVLHDGSEATAEQLRDAVRAQLRGSKTPDRIVFRGSLPHTDTGKMLRRVVLHGHARLAHLTSSQLSSAPEPRRRTDMSLAIKPGTRLYGAGCTTELIAVKAPAGDVDLTIGGAPALTDAAGRDESAGVRRGPRRRSADGQAVRGRGEHDRAAVHEAR